MNQYSKITPKWGKNIYNLWGCESLVYDDQEKEKIIRPLGSDPIKVSIKQMLALRKLNKIVCRDCKHYNTGQCSFSKEDVELNTKKYKVLKPKCSCCGFPLTFHQFLLNNNSQEKICPPCAEAKINCTFDKKKKQQRSSKFLEICEVIFLFIMVIFTSLETLMDGVFDWGDYIFIGLFSLIFIGYLSYYLIKRRKKKKIEEEN